MKNSLQLGKNILHVAVSEDITAVHGAESLNYNEMISS